MKDASRTSFHRLLIKGSYSILMILMRKHKSNFHVRNLTPTLTPPSVSVFPRGYSTLYPLDKMDDFRDK
ncbi:MAG: hypothetical protein AABX32_05930 [Nanoarchaeota archaeon]